MSGWGNKDYANNVPQFVNTIGRTSGDTARYKANTILVSSARMANANTSVLTSSKQFAHTGWVRIDKGTGGRAGRVITETLVAMSSPVITSANSANGWFTS